MVRKMTPDHRKYQNKPAPQNRPDDGESLSAAAPVSARRAALSVAILGATGLWLGFPNPLLQVPALVLLYPLALLELARTAASWRRAFRNGLGCGILGCSACLYWISVPIHDFGHLPWLVAVPTAISLGCYLALYSAVFTAAMHWSWRNLSPLWLGIMALSAWALLEYLKGWVLSGFAWLTLSAAFVPWYPVVQGAALIGAYALSGLFVAMVAWLAGAWRQKSKACLAAALLTAASLTVFGGINLAGTAPTPDKAFRVLLVQGNINQDQKWNPANVLATINSYTRLTASGLERLPGADVAGSSQTSALMPPLVIWPETAMPFMYSMDYAYGLKLRNLAREAGINLLFGVPGMEAEPNLAPEEYPLFNRAHLIDATGKDAGIYEKEHLVPFGEYPPSWINLPFLDFFLAQVGDFTPGVRTQPLSLNGIALGVLICYETIFPELSQRRAEQGATVLVNISNDAWFGLTSAPEQHLQLTAMRAVEQGRYLLRGTNTGISSLVDPWGRILFRSRLFSAEAIPVVAYARDGHTPFFFVANYMPWLLTALLALACSSQFLRRRGQPA